MVFVSLEDERPFIGRELYTQSFKNALGSIKEKERSILIYHGVTGIGKTRLLYEFTHIIEDYNKSNKYSRFLNASINFETPEFRQPQKFLEILRNQFQDKYGTKFYTFDIAHAIYWSKVNPRIPLYRENYSENSIVTDLINIGSKLPTIGCIFNLAKLSSDIKKLVNKLPNKYYEWALNNIDEITRLINMEPSDIEKRLYLYWAYDLHENLKKTSEAAIILIDSYQALWGKDRSLAKLSSEDTWIWKLIQCSSSCLWVICGQEPPQWERFSEMEMTLSESQIEIHKLESLQEEESRELLEYYDVLDKDIQDTIILGSAGVPFYLYLSIETYKNIKKIRKPEPSDFAKVPAEVFEHFIRYLDESKEAAIKVLSVPNFWDHDIFCALIKEFTNYPVNNLSILHSFSFVNKDGIEDNKWSMHQLMRRSWQEYQEKNELEDRTNVHKFMIDYYVNKMKDLDIKRITQKQKTALIEAFYHAKEVKEAHDLLNWFITASDPFYKAAFWQLITHVYGEMLQILEEKLGSEHQDVSKILNNLAELYKLMGYYKKALPLILRALEIVKKGKGTIHPDVAIGLNNLAELYRYMGKYKTALETYQMSFEIMKKYLDPNHPDFAIPLNRLGELYRQLGEYQQALPFYQRALEITEMDKGSQNPDYATILNNIALLYWQKGDYEKAFPIYHLALEIYEKVQDPQHPDIARILNNLALIYTDLEEYETAFSLFQRALDIREKYLNPQHPDVATTLNNIALIYRKIGENEKALPLYQRALNIRETVLGPEHPDVATILNNIAALYERGMGDYEKALPIYYRALIIRETALGPKHIDVGISLNNLALLHCQMEEYEKALPLFQRALGIIEPVLGPNHPQVLTTVHNLAVVFNEIGDYENALPLLQRLETSSKYS